MTVLGCYIDCDNALCLECYRHERVMGRLDNLQEGFPLAIDSTTEVDTPTHCAICERLIPHQLTEDGMTYVREHCENGTGRPEILAAWRDAYAPTSDLGPIRYWPTECRCDTPNSTDMCSIHGR